MPRRIPRREIEPVELLAGLPLFRELGPAAIGRLAARARKLRLARGEVLFHRGEPPAGFYVVVYGQVGLFAPAARGARLTGTVGAGRSFGEPIMFVDKPTLVDAVAQRDALVLLVPKDSVFDEIDRNPRFARLLLAGMAARIERLVHELDAQAQGGAQPRLAAYLLRLAGVAAAHAHGSTTLTLPAAKVAIASQLGMTPEHLSRLLREMTQQGLLQVEGRRIALLDLAQLAQVAAAGRRRKRDAAAQAVK